MAGRKHRRRSSLLALHLSRHGSNRRHQIGDFDADTLRHLRTRGHAGNVNGIGVHVVLSCQINDQVSQETGIVRASGGGWFGTRPGLGRGKSCVHEIRIPVPLSRGWIPGGSGFHQDKGVLIGDGLPAPIQRDDGLGIGGGSVLCTVQHQEHGRIRGEIRWQINLVITRDAIPGHRGINECSGLHCLAQCA